MTNNMYKFLIYLLLFIPVSLLSEPLQEFKPEVKIGGQIRYRGEFDFRFFDMNGKPLFINMLRSRLNAEAILSPNVKAFVQFQDSRNFGEENSRPWRGTLDGSADNIDLHQGWIEFKDLGAENLTVRLGRMMFNTNNERIIGSLEWHNFGRAYDGGWASYKYSDWSARGFAFLLGSQELLMTSAVPQIPKMVGGFEVNVPYIPSGNVYIYYDMNDKTIPVLGPGAPTSLPKLSRYTAGLFTKNDKPGIIWELESALQFGTIDTLPRLSNNQTNDISAWLISAFGGYKEGNFSLGAGVDVYSGDDPNTDAFEGFDHLFFTIHKFYGAMDFFPFNVLPNAGIRPGIKGTTNGLLMPNIKASWNPVDKWKFDLAFLMFRTVEPFNFEGDELYSLGNEIDLLATCIITKGVNVQFGASTFLPSTILENTNPSSGLGTDPAFWGYTMITIDF